MILDVRFAGEGGTTPGQNNGESSVWRARVKIIREVTWITLGRDISMEQAPATATAIYADRRKVNPPEPRPSNLSGAVSSNESIEHILLFPQNRGLQFAPGLEITTHV
jgi:hypothetical protein